MDETGDLVYKVGKNKENNLRLRIKLKPSSKALASWNRNISVGEPGQIGMLVLEVEAAPAAAIFTMKDVCFHFYCFSLSYRIFIQKINCSFTVRNW